MQDWGERDPRWRGIRSEWRTVHGTDVHLLRADGPADATPHLLIHGLGGAAINWIEVMGGLAATGPVAAVDLPGFGLSEPEHPDAARIPVNVRFVRALCRELGWDRVVLHGNSMGGLIATLVAGREPDLIESLVLVSPGLPTPRTAAHRLPAMALLTFAPFALPPAGRRLLESRYRRYSAEQLAAGTAKLIHGDPSRVRAAVRELSVEHARRGKELAWRLPAFAAAASSLVGMLVSGQRVYKAIDTVTAPTLVLWGDRDRLVGRAVIDGLVARRPTWDSHVFEGVGHVPMVETPDDHLEVVLGWLASRDAEAVTV